MYTTDIQDNGTVSATDEERLPPGGFSLRHGFPGWFGRGSRSRQTSSQTPTAAHNVQTPPRAPRADGGISSNLSTPTPNSKSSSTPGGSVPSFMQTRRRETSTYEVLRYILSTFNDAVVLDSVPLEAAGNPGAWHAWRTHRHPGGGPDARRPGEWNWEGVWEERVRKGIAASLSEPVLYGGAAGADDVVSFCAATNGRLAGVCC